MMKIAHKILFSKNLISQTLVTENYSEGVVLHIGYESTEGSYFDNPDRQLVNEPSQNSTVSYLKSIKQLEHLLQQSNLKIGIKNESKEYCLSDNINQ